MYNVVESGHLDYYHGFPSLLGYVNSKLLSNIVCPKGLKIAVAYSAGVLNVNPDLYDIVFLVAPVNILNNNPIKHFYLFFSEFLKLIIRLRLILAFSVFTECLKSILFDYVKTHALYHSIVHYTHPGFHNEVVFNSLADNVSSCFSNSIVVDDAVGHFDFIIDTSKYAKFINCYIANYIRRLDISSNSLN